MRGEIASDKAKRIVGRVIVETLEESGIAFVHASELEELRKLDQDEVLLCDGREQG